MTDFTETAETTCPICNGEGAIDVRHPELDDELMTTVWLSEFCECEAGVDAQAAYENAYDIED